MHRRTLSLATAAAALLTLVGTGAAHGSNDPGFSQQWGLAQIGAPAAWARSTGAGVTIGIVDTGVDLGHPDLQGGKIGPTTNCIGSGGDASKCSGNAQDDNGHGTHVSGIAAANKDNNVGVAGVAPSAQLVVAKALDKNGSGDPADVAAGIAWVVQHGARVVNLSLGDGFLARTLFGDPNFDQAVTDAWNAGAVPVIAAGNENYLLGLGSQNYGSLNAVVVGATGPEGDMTSYSSPIGSAKWGVMAPGGDDQNKADCSDQGQQQARCVLSTWNGGVYAWLQGTSMATPHVTGAVALLLAQHLTRDAAVQQILNMAAPIVGCASSDCGHGRLDVAKAVGLAPTPPPAPSTGTKSSGSSPSPSGATSGGTAAPRGGSRASGAGRSPSASQPAPGSAVTSDLASPTSSAQLPPTDNPVVAAGRLPGQHNTSGGRPSSRALEVGAAIALLGGAGLGVGLLFRLRGGAAP